MSDSIYTLAQASRETGLPRSALDRMLFDKQIGDADGRITKEDVEKILYEQTTYIGLLEYSRRHGSDHFDPELSYDRIKLAETIEMNNRFGLRDVNRSELITSNIRDGMYFYRADVPVLDASLADFFMTVGLSGREAADKYIETTPGHSATKKYLRKYDELYMNNGPYEDTYAEFVKTMLRVPDVTELDNDDVAELMSRPISLTARDHIIVFLTMVRRQEKVAFGNPARKKRKSNPLPAYDNATYLSLALCIFNADYIAGHQMIEKALENHVFAEMWLFHALFYCCGWRAQDVCNNWQYLDIKGHDEGVLGINPDTLREDILQDRLPDNLYINVCRYSLGQITASGAYASKTASYNQSPLMAIITPGLYTFFGLLVLIAEAHMISAGNGYMDASRVYTYTNISKMRGFYGGEINSILEGKNLKTRRLNKDYLQAVESTAASKGVGGVMTSMIASIARNHRSLDTIKFYLKDHNFNGETAEFVLFSMMQRGVFGFELYQVLLAAYPQAMHNLTMAEQNDVMQQMKITPFEIETAMSIELESTMAGIDFVNEDEETTLATLKAMYEISQGRGQGKEEGVYCLLRARKEQCPRSMYKSCLASGCPYLVFTRLGYRSLLIVLHKYRTAEKAGDLRMSAILRKVLIPKYRQIIRALMKDVGMPEDERNALQLMLGEVVNG